MRNVWKLGLCAALAVGAVRADEVVFCVGGDKDAGKAMSKASGGKYCKSLTKGFKEAGKQLAEGGAMTVVVKVAAGDYDGDLGSGAFELPSLRNAEATLRIEGGYSADFTSRDPFHTPSQIVTVEDRRLSLWTFYNSRNPNHDQDVLKALVIDGFLMDVGNSNNYDKKSNALLGRGTCTKPVIRFRNLMVDQFTVQNCVFINSPHRVFETLLRPGSDSSTFRLYNNVFMNCVIPLKLVHALTRDKMIGRMEVDHNSFLMNWPMNPDPNTGSPATMEISDYKYFKEVFVTNNLFYANFGSAILILGQKMSEVTVNGNDFVGQGLLWGKTDPAAAAMQAPVGGKMLPIDVDTIEDLDFIEEAEDNVTIDPGIPLVMGDVKTVDADSIKPDDSWENSVARLLGKPLDGGKVDVGNFAPRMTYDPQHPPFPTNPEAKKYGASPELVGK